jgi:hypothetical protein
MLVIDLGQSGSRVRQETSTSTSSRGKRNGETVLESLRAIFQEIPKTSAEVVALSCTGFIILLFCLSPAIKSIKIGITGHTKYFKSGGTELYKTKLITITYIADNPSQTLQLNKLNKLPKTLLKKVLIICISIPPSFSPLL